MAPQAPAILLADPKHREPAKLPPWGAARAETEPASHRAVKQGRGTSSQQNPQQVEVEAKGQSNTAENLLEAQQVSAAVKLRKTILSQGREAQV